MPLTTLDSNAALLVIDLQKGLVGLPLAHPAVQIVERSAQLARAFRERGLPVFLINVVAAPKGRTEVGPRNFAFPDDWTELVPELDQQPADHLVSKQCVSAFLGTRLDETLRKLAITQIFLTGIATSAGVEATGACGFDLGYNVVFVSDAMTDRDLEMHTRSVEKVFPKRGEIDTAANVLKLLRG